MPPRGLTRFLIASLFAATLAIPAQAGDMVRRMRDVRDMGGKSEVVQKLRPVAFTYRNDAAAGSYEQYGLIPEQVARVAPNLVARDDDGRPFSIRYQLLPPLLVGEIQNQQRQIDSQRALIRKQARRIAELERRTAAIEELRAAVEALSSDGAR